MYALIYQNRVIVGPMDWNRALFSGALESKKITFGLPRVAPETLPLIVNEETKICTVTEVREEINPLVQYHYGPLWDVSGDVAIATYQATNTQIEFARDNYKNAIAAKRYLKEISGGTTVIQGTNVSLDTTRDGRNIFVQKYMLMGENDTVHWKFPEGWLLLTKSELGQTVAAGAAHIQAAFDWELSKAEAVDAAQTTEELLLINIEE